MTSHKRTQPTQPAQACIRARAMHLHSPHVKMLQHTCSTDRHASRRIAWLLHEQQLREGNALWDGAPRKAELQQGSLVGA